MKNIKKPGGNHIPLSKAWWSQDLSLAYPLAYLTHKLARTRPHPPFIVPFQAPACQSVYFTILYTQYHYHIHNFGTRTFWWIELCKTNLAVWLSISSEGASVHPKVALETMGVKGSVPRPSRSPTWRRWSDLQGIFPKKTSWNKNPKETLKVQL